MKLSWPSAALGLSLLCATVSYADPVTGHGRLLRRDTLGSRLSTKHAALLRRRVDHRDALNRRDDGKAAAGDATAKTDLLIRKRSKDGGKDGKDGQGKHGAANGHHKKHHGHHHKKHGKQARQPPSPASQPQGQPAKKQKPKDQQRQTQQQQHHQQGNVHKSTQASTSSSSSSSTTSSNNKQNSNGGNPAATENVASDQSQSDRGWNDEGTHESHSGFSFASTSKQDESAKKGSYRSGAPKSFEELLNAPLKGRGTFFTPDVGACGNKNVDTDLVVAISADLFDPLSPNGNPNKNPLCGHTVELNFGGKKVRAKVADSCPTCPHTSIDMTETAFKMLADPDVGVLNDMSWSFVE